MYPQTYIYIYIDSINIFLELFPSLTLPKIYTYL